VGPSSIADTWNLQSKIGNGTVDSSSIFTFSHVGTTGVAAVQVPQLDVGATDTGISRLGAASLAIGDGTAGDFTGSLKLTNLSFPDGTTFTSSKRVSTYVFTTDGTNVYATAQKAGLSNYSGTDAAVVINNVLAALCASPTSALGGDLYFCNGVYPINSLTQETVTGWTGVYYGIGIPSTQYLYGVTFKFEGESMTQWAGEGANPSSISQVNGVIFNVTATAMASVISTAFVAAVWQRPFTAATFGSDFSDNTVWFSKICVRFPVN